MRDLTATLSHSDHNLFRSDVVEGLSHLQKTIPCRWLYDGVPTCSKRSRASKITIRRAQ
jgi:uncharacterized SAM-dependent methyltransferase